MENAETTKVSSSSGGPELDDSKPLKARRTLVLLGCLVLLAGMGWLDYTTGYELSFFVFYSAPIGFAAWYAGRWASIIVALGATFAWLLADYFGGVKYSSNYIYYWNSTIHFLAFIINAITIAKIKSDIDRRHVLARELKVAQAALQKLSSRPAACPSCGQSLDSSGTVTGPQNSKA